MKSLEIVNEIVKDFEKGEMRPLYIEKSMNKIKQDLEVLEIIRKKQVDLEVLKHSLGTYNSNMFKALYCYNGEFLEEYHLTMEELLKLKQWLEDNENETIL